MPWIPITESTKEWTFSTIIPDLTFMEGSDVVATNTAFPMWTIEFEEASMIRVVVHEFSQTVFNDNTPISSILFYNLDTDDSSISYNESMDYHSTWEPVENESEFPVHQTIYSTAEAQVEVSFRMSVYVWEEEGGGGGGDEDNTCPPDWWACCPAPTPDPIPIRPVGFVPLEDYDTSFTYPLKSSRIPSHNPADDCVVCGPEFVPAPDPDPDPDPEPELEFATIFYVGCILDFLDPDPLWYELDFLTTVDPPTWWDSTTGFKLIIGDWEGIYTQDDTPSGPILVEENGEQPYCCEPLQTPGKLIQGDNVALVNFQWFCG